MKQELPVAWRQDSCGGATAGNRDFEKHFMSVQPGKDVGLGEERKGVSCSEQKWHLR